MNSMNSMTPKHLAPVNSARQAAPEEFLDSSWFEETERRKSYGGPRVAWVVRNKIRAAHEMFNPMDSREIY